MTHFSGNGFGRTVVLMGGTSSERAVSLASGGQVYDCLRSLGLDVVAIDIVSEKDAYCLIREVQPAVAFIALHGKFGEDGTIQAMLESMQIPYTGSGILASALAMNKAAAKKVFLRSNIPTPEFEVTNLPKTSLEFPVITKPLSQGSAIGVSLVRCKDEFEAGIRSARLYGREVIVERYIRGIEVTQAIIDDGTLCPLPLIEILPGRDFYDYVAKYHKGMSEHIIPPRIGQESQKAVTDAAKRAHTALGCRGMSRVDIILGEDGVPYVLEVNTIPGMTPTSLVPDAVRAAGIDFSQFCLKLLKMAVGQRFGYS
jgi:D-alanine-D-alanine ligase